MKPARKGERGASLVETTIVMGVVLALLFAVIDFGRFMYTYAFVAQVAREAARWAIVRGSQCTQLDHCNATQSDIQNYVQSLSEGATNGAIFAVTAVWGSCPAGLSGNAPGCTISVTVKYPFTFMLPYMPGPKLQVMMASTSQMVISQ